MKRFIALFMLVFPLVLTSCESPKAKEEKLAKEVLQLHDEVMPKMQDMMRLKKELKKSVAELDSTNAEVENVKKLIGDLDQADKDMMDWMHNYNGAQDLYTHDEIMQYLQAEKAKMEKIKQDTDNAINAANTYLSK